MPVRSALPMAADATFEVTANPTAGSRLPWLLRLPIDGGLVLAAKEPWPTTGRVYCHRYDGDWPADAEVSELPVRLCRRRGAAIDLVLDRAKQSRSQFVFTRARGRELILWQTPATTRAARPGQRIPRARPEGFGKDPLLIIVDTRERYPWKFANRPATIAREALPAGDYAVVNDAYDVVGCVERKKLDDLAGCLSDGSLAFAVAELAGIPSSAVVVEGRYAELLSHEHAPGAWLADQLARIQARTPDVPIVFCDTRPFAEEWTWRFLAAAATEHHARFAGQLTLG